MARILFVIVCFHPTCILNMVLWVKDDWFNFFCNASIPADTVYTYATAFVNSRVTETTLPWLNRQYLTELGITSIGDVLTILAHTTTDPVPTTTAPNTTPPPPKSTKAKPPQVTSEMTHPHFCKFKIDWDIFKHILSDQITAQLYNLCDDSVQNSIIDTVTDSFNKMNPLICKSLKTSLPSVQTQLSTICIFGTLPKHPWKPSKLVLLD